MTNEEIVKALRCTSTPPGGEKQNCELCAFYRKEPLNDELREKLQCEEWFSCDTDAVGLAAADLIERLTAENVVLPDGEASAIESLRKEIEWKDMVIALAQRKQAEAEAERDALLEYAKLFTGCDTCKRRNYCKSDSECNACEQDVKGNCYCKDCERGSKWEWKGLAEASEGEKT